jgi:hypothetical protein
MSAARPASDHIAPNRVVFPTLPLALVASEFFNSIDPLRNTAKPVPTVSIPTGRRERAQRRTGASWTSQLSALPLKTLASLTSIFRGYAALLVHQFGERGARDAKDGGGGVRDAQAQGLYAFTKYEASEVRGAPRRHGSVSFSVVVQTQRRKGVMVWKAENHAPVCANRYFPHALPTFKRM